MSKELKSCPACKKKISVEVERCLYCGYPKPFVKEDIKCPKCKGEGKIVDKAVSLEPRKCSKCHGKRTIKGEGYVPREGKPFKKPIKTTRIEI